MNQPVNRSTARRFPWAVALGAVAALAVVAAGVWSVTGAAKSSRGNLITHLVKRADLPIVVTARGSLESQVETTIMCEVESVSSSRTAQAGTQIIYIVPNGSAVKKGDVLVELDSAPIREQLDAQTLSYQSAVSEQIQATARYDNQITQNETSEEEANLAKELAELELKMYDDTESGTYKLELDEKDRAIETARNGVLEALANLSLQETELTGIKRLFELGYRGKGDLDESNYAFMRAEDALASATNTLTTALAERRKLEEFESAMQRKQLEGAVDSKTRSLAQVRRDNQSSLDQAKAAKDAADQRLAKEGERLENYKRQVENCVIKAPHDGMVVYARERSRNTEVEIAPGAFVRERQAILTLPDLSKMQVATSIHESVLNQVAPGERVTVRVDAFPDRTYQGVVMSVAVLPDMGGWNTSDTKMYETIIKIDGEVDRLKPGMTSVAEIHVDQLKDVLTIPIQAIRNVRRETWCYVETDNGPERRLIQLGQTNEKFAEVRTGIEEGDLVVLNASDIVDQSNSATELAPQDSAADGMIAQDGAGDEQPVLETANRGGRIPGGGGFQRGRGRGFQGGQGGQGGPPGRGGFPGTGFGGNRGRRGQGGAPSEAALDPAPPTTEG